MTRAQIEKMKRNIQRHRTGCTCGSCHWNQAIKAVLSLLPEDCVIVPRIPTKEMIRAGTDALLEPKLRTGHPAGSEMAEAIFAYTAMISAHQKEVG